MESYYYAMSHEMTQDIRVRRGTCVRSLRPLKGELKYTDIDFENHSHLSTT